jgi:hypothetical protein
MAARTYDHLKSHHALKRPAAIPHLAAESLPLTIMATELTVQSERAFQVSIHIQAGSSKGCL